MSVRERESGKKIGRVRKNHSSPQKVPESTRVVSSSTVGGCGGWSTSTHTHTHSQSDAY